MKALPTPAEIEKAEKKRLEERRHLAAKVIQEHFSAQPDGVIIASIAEGKVKVNVTDFPSLAELSFVAKLTEQFVNESFSKTILMQQTAQKAEEAQEGNQPA